MGLQSKIQTKVAEAFDGPLADAVRDFRLTQLSRGSYDSTTGNVSQTSATELSRGVFDEYSAEELETLNIDPQSVKVIILQNEITLVPRIADLITRLSDSQNFRIALVERDPADATYIAHCRVGNP